MEDLGVSEHPGAVVKTKSSSGCLIVEKKAVTGVGVVSDSPSRKLFNSSEDKKRPRVVLTDSESSDELLDRKVRKIRKNLKECEDFQTEMVSNGLDESAVDNDESSLPLCTSNENEEQNLDQLNDGVMKVIANDNKQKESRTVKTVKRDRNAKKKMKNASSVNGKDSKHKRASCTEKQLLREKIKKMLFAAGWKIDYRPRRNRDYLDSVYISPSGSAYWSITKAYETLRKEEKSSSKAGDDFSNFTPLPNEILNKLTRQTRKKIEREIEKNRENEGKSRKSSSYKETPLKDGLILKKSAVRSSSRVVQGAKRKKNGRLTLLVRGSDTGLNSEDNGSVSLSYPKKRSLISWLIDSGIVSVGEKVEYMNLRKTRVMQEGWITEEGNIHCECCSKIITISRFELHAGSKLGQPFENVFLQSGQSLIQCQIDAWNEQKESERKGFHCVNIDCDDPNDDTCGICGDGGDLICCDGCPSTFHLSCLDMQMLPQGDWHCPNCVCKYCELVGVYSNKASGRTESSLLTCCLCEKKYHKSCSLEMGNRRIVSKDLNSSFCGKKCQELYNDLQKFLWVKHELDSGFSWSLIHRSDPLPDSTSVNFSQRVECNSKLAIALSVMDECFMPIVDGRSGITLIHNVVYNCGSNFSRLNFSGFFTAILERGDEIICAASIRIHGTQLAEMPFIGTRHLYRRQGMCRRLLQAIESALSFLKVEKLVIPAIEEHLHTWTNAFGFSPLEKAQRQEIRSVNMLVFPGTDMLQKLLMKQRTAKGRITSEKGKKDDYNKPLTKESESNSSRQNCNSSEHPSEHANRLSGEKPDGGSEDPVSVDAHSNSNSKPDAGSKDPVSIDADSNSKSNSIVVHNGNAVNLLSPKSPNLPLEPDLQLLGKESAHSIQDENRNV